jgi:hypothetical protein
VVEAGVISLGELAFGAAIEEVYAYVKLQILFWKIDESLQVHGARMRKTRHSYMITGLTDHFQIYPLVIDASRSRNPKGQDHGHEIKIRLRCSISTRARLSSFIRAMEFRPLKWLCHGFRKLRHFPHPLSCGLTPGGSCHPA